jgi:hypothetical protein
MNYLAELVNKELDKKYAKMSKAEEICTALKIDYTQILNIYPYGSKIYGTSTADSDEDFVIVYKSSFLPSGAFKDNAISSEDRKIQGTCYSRSGFQDAINNYQITALECIFLPEEKIIQKKMNFKMNKFVDKDFVYNIIKTASASWYIGLQAWKNQNIEFSKKNMYHALRILRFGLYIKETNSINYYKAKKYKELVYNCEKQYKPFRHHYRFLELMERLKK